MLAETSISRSLGQVAPERSTLSAGRNEVDLEREASFKPGKNERSAPRHSPSLPAIFTS